MSFLTVLNGTAGAPSKNDFSSFGSMGLPITLFNFTRASLYLSFSSTESFSKAACSSNFFYSASFLALSALRFSAWAASLSRASPLFSVFFSFFYFLHFHFPFFKTLAFPVPQGLSFLPSFPFHFLSFFFSTSAKLSTGWAFTTGVAGAEETTVVDVCATVVVFAWTRLVVLAAWAVTV